jgi:hypothetical protein
MAILLPIKDIVYFSVMTIGLTTGILKIRLLSTASHWLVFSLCFTIVSELSSEICRIVFKNNMMVFHIYNPVQYTLMALAYNQEIKRGTIIWATIIGYAGFAILNAIYWQPFFEEYCSYSFNVNVILVSSLCLYYLYRLLNEETDEVFTQYPLFWTSVGYLIYNCINILGLGAFNHLSANPNLAYILEVIRTLSNYMLYSMFMIAFLTKQKSLQTS